MLVLFNLWSHFFLLLQSCKVLSLEFSVVLILSMFINNIKLSWTLEQSSVSFWIMHLTKRGANVITLLVICILSIWMSPSMKMCHSSLALNFLGRVIIWNLNSSFSSLDLVFKSHLFLFLLLLCLLCLSYLFLFSLLFCCWFCRNQHLGHQN